MSNNRFVFEGLSELKAALRALPQELTAEARREAEAAANSAASDIKRGYPVITGDLRDGVQVDFEHGQFSAGAIVKNTARHAHLYDNGTQARHWTSGKSTGTMWGRSRPTHHFVSHVMRERRRMYQRLKDMLVRHGLIVTGDA